MRTTLLLALVPALAAGILSAAQSTQEPVDRSVIDGRDVINVANDKISLSLRAVGGAMVRLLIQDDSSQLNPFEGLGHFVCVDGFGPVSNEEQAAGLPGHGEAHRVPWDVVSSRKENGTRTVEFSAALPLVHDPVHVDRRRSVKRDGRAVAFVRYVNAGLPFHGREIPIDRALESCLLQD